jgi:rubrerythrin
VRAIASVEEFYAHALAIEREAVARYGEFAAWYAERGEEALARLCAGLARVEAEHEAQLTRGCSALALPMIEAGQHCWLDAGSPEAPAREFFYRVVTPRQLLEIALAAEMAARDFFERAAQGEGLPEVREAAVEMALEESLHVEWVLAALAKYPAPPG